MSRAERRTATIHGCYASGYTIGYTSGYTSWYIVARLLLLGLLVRTHQLRGAQHVALHRGLQVGLGRS